jgi:DNA-directed RNA polymerase specialized sigma24 family protein
MENDISDIQSDIETIIANAIDGNQTSLDQLMASSWLAGVLEEITSRRARQFKLDRNEIRDRICDKLRKKITTIKNPRQGPLTKCIRGWCNSTGRRFCLNGGRHRKVEARYAKRVIRENIHGTRKSPTGTIIPLQSLVTNSPEDNMLRKEADLLWANRAADLHKQVYNAIVKLPPEDINIALLWAEGLTLERIKQQTGIPLSTVQRHLKKFQREIIESIGIKKFIAENAELKKCALQLIINCLLEMNSRGYFPPRAA